LVLRDSAYGAVEPDQDDVPGNCGTAPQASDRRDPGGPVGSCFDQLQPEHAHHRNLVLKACDGAGRQGTLAVDWVTLIGLALEPRDGAAHRVSVRQEPAL
jgi:hypothetical protein